MWRGSWLHMLDIAGSFVSPLLGVFEQALTSILVRSPFLYHLQYRHRMAKQFPVGSQPNSHLDAKRCAVVYLSGAPYVLRYAKNPISANKTINLRPSSDFKTTASSSRKQHREATVEVRTVLCGLSNEEARSQSYLQRKIKQAHCRR